MASTIEKNEKSVVDIKFSASKEEFNEALKES